MRKLRHLFLALSLGLAAGAALAADEPGPRPSADLAKARTLIEQKDWNAAIGELERQARRDPKSADVQNLLGYSYRNAGQVDKAFTAYDNALRLDPNHKGAHEYIGVAYLLAKKPEKANEHLAKLKAICGGENCEEYQDLAKAIADYKP